MFYVPFVEDLPSRIFLAAILQHVGQYSLFHCVWPESPLRHHLLVDVNDGDEEEEDYH